MISDSALLAKVGPIDFSAWRTGVSEPVALIVRAASAAISNQVALGEGLFEFRVRHDAAAIESLYGSSPSAPRATRPTQSKILLRLFIHFHGNRVILLLHGYDKGSNDSPRQQNKEIQVARKRLTHWTTEAHGAKSRHPKN